MVFKMNFSKLNFLTELGWISFGSNHFRIFVSSFQAQIPASYSVVLSFHDFSILSLVQYVQTGDPQTAQTRPSIRKIEDKGEHFPIF